MCATKQNVELMKIFLNTNLLLTISQIKIQQWTKKKAKLKANRNNDATYLPWRKLAPVYPCCVSLLCLTRRYFWSSDICERRKWSHQIRWIELKGRPMIAKSLFFLDVFSQMNKFVILHWGLFICFCFRLFHLSSVFRIVFGKKLLFNNVRQIKTTAGNINKFRRNLDSKKKSKRGKKKKRKKKQSLYLVAKWANSKTSFQEYFYYTCNLNLTLWYSQT